MIREETPMDLLDVTAAAVLTASLAATFTVIWMRLVEKEVDNDDDS